MPNFAKEMSAIKSASKEMRQETPIESSFYSRSKSRLFSSRLISLDLWSKPHEDFCAEKSVEISTLQIIPHCLKITQNVAF